MPSVVARLRVVRAETRGARRIRHHPKEPFRAKNFCFGDESVKSHQEVGHEDVSEDAPILRIAMPNIGIQASYHDRGDYSGSHQDVAAFDSKHDLR